MALKSLLEKPAPMLCANNARLHFSEQRSVLPPILSLSLFSVSSRVLSIPIHSETNSLSATYIDKHKHDYK